MKNHLICRSLSRATANFCRATLLVLLAFFAGTIRCADAQQPGVTPPRQMASSPEGLWYYTGDEEVKFFIVVEIAATKQEGVFQVDGACADKKTRKPFGRISRGVYKQAVNKVEALFDRLDLLWQPDSGALPGPYSSFLQVGGTPLSPAS